VLKKDKGISDYPTYESHCATKREFNPQHNYFIRDLEKAAIGKRENLVTYRRFFVLRIAVDVAFINPF